MQERHIHHYFHVSVLKVSYMLVLIIVNNSEIHLFSTRNNIKSFELIIVIHVPSLIFYMVKTQPVVNDLNYL